MICAVCGTANREGRKFCIECGAPLAAACPSCSAPLEAGAKFCGECGAGVAPGAAAVATTASAAPAEPATERRLVSVLFADLVGFTTLAEGRDAEAVRDLLSRYFDVATEVVERYGGSVEKFIGDAVMAVWGTPVAREDDAERAVRAALDLVGAVRALGGDVGVSLAARAGVLTGEAAVSLGARNQGMVAGDLVNTAARLQSVAAEGTVLVGEATRAAAAGAIVFEEAGAQALKGKLAPVAAYRAVRVVAGVGGRDRSDILEPPFVGRETEYRLLRQLFHATGRDRKARLVAITGQPGIGKSRLAWEFSKYTDGVVETVYWHQGRSPSYGDGLTFWALGEMVRRRAQLVEGDDEGTSRARIAASLDEWIADPADRDFVEPCLLALLGLGDPPPGGRERLFAGWRTFFERIAEKGTVALVFEDLHWADDGLLDFIEHLLEWSRSYPIFVVTLARPELMDRRPTWGATRNATALALGPLDEEDVRALLAGMAPGLPEAAVRSILERADGIPLYAVETIRTLVADGRLIERGGVYVPTGDLGALEVPATLAALIAARLDALDPAARGLVGDASVLGQTFSVSALAAVAGITEDELEPRLRDLARREILELDTDPRSPERGQYGFVQSLIREVAYGRLARRDRRARHLAAARYFEAIGDEELAGALATHYLAAYRALPEGPEGEAVAAQARVSLRAAAERASALGAPGQALAYLAELAVLTTDAREAAALRERAGSIADDAARHEEAVGHFRAAREAYDALPDRAAAAGALAGMARALSRTGRWDEAAELLARGKSEYDDVATSPGGVRISATLAGLYSRRNEDAAAIAEADQALAAAERLGLVPVIVDLLVTKGTSMGTVARFHEAVALLDGAARLAERHGLAAQAMRAASMLALVVQDDDPRTAFAEGREALVAARRVGLLTQAVFLAGNAAEVGLRLGEWDWGVAALDDILGADLEEFDRILVLAQRTVYASVRGEPSDAQREALRRAGEGRTDFAAWTTDADLWHATAAGDARRALSLGLDAARRDPLNAPVMYERAAIAAARLGDAATLETIATEYDTLGRQGRLIAAIRGFIIALKTGIDAPREEVVAAFRGAASAYRDIGCTFWVGLAQLEAVRVLGAGTDEGRQAASEARAILGRLGAAPFQAQLDALETAAVTA